MAGSVEPNRRGDQASERATTLRFRLARQAGLVDHRSCRRPTKTNRQPDHVTVVSLVHGFSRKRSIVTLVSASDPEMRVALPVPFGCDFADLREEAEQAWRDQSGKRQGSLSRQRRNGPGVFRRAPGMGGTFRPKLRGRQDRLGPAKRVGHAQHDPAPVGRTATHQRLGSARIDGPGRFAPLHRV